MDDSVGEALARVKDPRQAAQTATTGWIRAGRQLCRTRRLRERSLVGAALDDRPDSGRADGPLSERRRRSLALATARVLLKSVCDKEDVGGV